jgi:hypothetical protein
MISCAIITLSTGIRSIEDTDIAFVAVYSILFALLLLFYELLKCDCLFQEVEDPVVSFFRSQLGLLSTLLLRYLPHASLSLCAHRKFWVSVFNHQPRFILDIVRAELVQNTQERCLTLTFFFLRFSIFTQHRISHVQLESSTRRLLRRQSRRCQV